MDNVTLGRETLDFIDANPGQFDMGDARKCIMGTALKLAGYTIPEGGPWLRPDGSKVKEYPDRETRKVLGLTDDEYRGGDEDALETGWIPSLFSDMDRGLERFRKIVGDSEQSAALR